MAIFTAAALGVDMDALEIGALAGLAAGEPTATSFSLSSPGVVTRFTGSGFQYAGGLPTGGTIDRMRVEVEGQLLGDLQGFSIPASTFFGLVSSGANALARATLLAGSDSLTGSPLGDRLRGYAGDDTISGGLGGDVLDGGDGDDDVFGGAGDDTVTDSDGANYLRGEEGNDHLVGGGAFDDMHGNMGDDVVYGGFGSDWVVGGKDNDLLFGEDGDDLVYGNLGNDTCDGGAGADIIRGGQGGDSMTGGLGADFLSGDRGDDTMTGGGGADLFSSFAEAGIDRVLDFSVAEGDRVRLDPGSTFTIAQVGGDTVITVGGAATVVLVGVSMASLTSSSVFVA
jgi:serralysin